MKTATALWGPWALVAVMAVACGWLWSELHTARAELAEVRMNAETRQPAGASTNVPDRPAAAIANSTAPAPSGETTSPLNDREELVTVPAFVLSSLSVPLGDGQGHISEKFAAVAGLRSEQKAKLEAALGNARSQLRELQRSRSRVVAQGNETVLTIPKHAAEGAMVKRTLLEEFEKTLDPLSFKFLMPSVMGELESSFGYFGEVESQVVLAQGPRGARNGFHIQSRYAFEDGRTLETTSMFPDVETLFAAYPGFAGRLPSARQ